MPVYIYCEDDLLYGAIDVPDRPHADDVDRMAIWQQGFDVAIKGRVHESQLPWGVACLGRSVTCCCETIYENKQVVGYCFYPAPFHYNVWADVPENIAAKYREAKLAKDFERPAAENTVFYYDFERQRGINLAFGTEEQYLLNATWILLWNEIQEWYGDITKTETPEEFLERMKKKFRLRINFEQFNKVEKPKLKL